MFCFRTINQSSRLPLQTCTMIIQQNPKSFYLATFGISQKFFTKFHFKVFLPTTALNTWTVKLFLFSKILCSFCSPIRWYLCWNILSKLVCVELERGNQCIAGCLRSTRSGYEANNCRSFLIETRNGGCSLVEKPDRIVKFEKLHWEFKWIGINGKIFEGLSKSH